MKVGKACRLSPDGIAETRVKFRTRDNHVIEVSLYAKFNEVQGKYTVGQYYHRQKVETFPEFQNPHRIERWRPSKKMTSESLKIRQLKMDPCLFMLIAQNKYRFTLGITSNIYMRIYQLRLLYGEFDLESSCIVNGREDHLKKLESHLQFIFEEYHAARPTPLDDEERNWFDLDCFWYAKNEVRRLDNFREEKIYLLRESIDLNKFVIEDVNLLSKDFDIAPKLNHNNCKEIMPGWDSVSEQ